MPFAATFTLTAHQDDILFRVREMSGVTAGLIGDALAVIASEPFDATRLDQAENIIKSLDPRATRA